MSVPATLLDEYLPAEFRNFVSWSSSNQLLALPRILIFFIHRYHSFLPGHCALTCLPSGLIMAQCSVYISDGVLLSNWLHPKRWKE